jgi:adenosylcobinamide-GDP ribazoletransferase
LTPLLLAFQFLTRYPVGPPTGVAVHERDLGASTRYFPLVGLVAGLDLLLARWMLGWAGALEHWPLACSALLLAYWAWTCDSLHLDGWMDTMDGLASRREGQALLDVMHDSRLGAFGALGGALALILKLAFLASLPPRLWWALPLPLVFSRLLASLLCHARPYAGKAGSLSGAFITGNEPSDGQASLAIAFLSLGAYGAVVVGLGAVAPLGLLKALGLCLMGLVMGLSLVSVPRRRLGGISGDLIGYGMVGCEVACCYLLLLGGV